jgi:hypothetical protein
MRYANDQIHPLDDPRLVAQFLDQDKAWCDSGLNYTTIESMGRQHALNTARFILRKAQDICLSLAVATGARLSVPLDEQPTALEKVLRAAVRYDSQARAVLLDKPLVQALLARAAVTSSSRLPWEEIETVPTSGASGITVSRAYVALGNSDDVHLHEHYQGDGDFDDLPF